MTREERKAQILEVLKSFPEDLQAIIKRNMEEGLLCACNQTKIPYFSDGDEQTDSHGFRYENGVRHGYDDCQPWVE